jgi:hypothetical protein
MKRTRSHNLLLPEERNRLIQEVVYLVRFIVDGYADTGLLRRRGEMEEHDVVDSVIPESEISGTEEEEKSTAGSVSVTDRLPQSDIRVGYGADDVPNSGEPVNEQVEALDGADLHA